MNSREIIRILETDGFRRIRSTDSHHWFWNSELKRGVSVVHPQRDAKLGTLIGYERASGVSPRRR